MIFRGHLGRGRGMGRLGGSSLTPTQLRSLFLSVGFPSTVATQMTAVALKESGGNPAAYNGVGRDNSYGLTQINMYGNLGPARLQQCGLTSASQLLDPTTNATCAFRIWNGSAANLDQAWGIDTWDAAAYQRTLPAAEAVAGLDTNEGGSGELMTGGSSSAGPVTALVSPLTPSTVDDTLPTDTGDGGLTLDLSSVSGLGMSGAAMVLLAVGVAFVGWKAFS